MVGAPDEGSNPFQYYRQARRCSQICCRLVTGWVMEYIMFTSSVELDVETHKYGGHSLYQGFYLVRQKKALEQSNLSNSMIVPKVVERTH